MLLVHWCTQIKVVTDETKSTGSETFKMVTVLLGMETISFLGKYFSFIVFFAA